MHSRLNCVVVRLCAHHCIVTQIAPPIIGPFSISILLVTFTHAKLVEHFPPKAETEAAGDPRADSDGCKSHAHHTNYSSTLGHFVPVAMITQWDVSCERITQSILAVWVGFMVAVSPLAPITTIVRKLVAIFECEGFVQYFHSKP
jgi:hypothetical protein